MAETVGGAFLSAFIQVLFDRLTSDEFADLFRGKKPVVELLDELNTLLSSANLLLNDAEEKQIRDGEVRKWLDKLKEVIYDADDLVDTIDYEALRCKLEAKPSSSTGKVLKKFSDLFTGFDITVKREATEILHRLNILLDQKDALGLKEGFQTKPSERPYAPLVEESSVYGRNDDKEAIVDLLLSNDDSGDKISVIPIVGMGGIGKTTLAQLVYDDKRVKEHFELKAWVTVLDEFDVFKITKVIFERVTSKKCEVDDLFELQRQLKEALRGKRFLFVHDDVWNEKYHLWDTLKSSFESGADGSKIIVTTRSTYVASVMAVGPTHHLSDLSDEYCWQLFAKHAFGSNADPNEHQDLQAIGREIVKKCKGLPLAVKSLGGLLRSERNPKKWENILKSDVWELSKKEGSIFPALWLSYRHLPTYLKRCFAYCSIFPKDYAFEKEKIILLWMAEGLLQSDKQGKSMEELGEEYVQDLLSKSIFQQSSQRPFTTSILRLSNEDERLLLMHDLVHDLAMFVSGEFCFRLDDVKNVCNLTSKTRHVSYKRPTHGFDKSEGSCKAKCLRTLLAFPMDLSEWGLFWKNVEVPCDLLLTAKDCLRVLSLSQLGIKELPDSIGKLKRLRYLDLSQTMIRELPDSICTLYNLQTLLLTWCRFLKRLPKNMGSLINLRHLDVELAPLEEMPLQISALKELRTLSNMILGERNSGAKNTDLKELQHLRGKLDISGLENVVNAAEASEANLKDKKFFTELGLRWNADAAADAESSTKEREVLDALRPHTNLRALEIGSYRGTTFSDWVGHDSFSNIVKICLSNCKNCWFLPPLGQLPSLRDLTINGLDSVVSVGDEFHCNTGPSFRSLESLCFRNMLEWKEWSFSEATIHKGTVFPRLTRFELEACPQLIVGFPGYLPSLEHLSIGNCQKMEVLLPRAQQTVTAFPSLVSVLVMSCPALESLLDWGSNSKLKAVRLWSSKKLFENRMNWNLQRLSSLESLNIAGWEDASFPDEGLLPTSLREIYIQDSFNLVALNGKAFQQLVSLVTLLIYHCENLLCVPEEGLPASLSDLAIEGCPVLQYRLREGGEDWPKVAHIAELSMPDVTGPHSWLRSALSTNSIRKKLGPKIRERRYKLRISF